MIRQRARRATLLLVLGAALGGLPACGQAHVEHQARITLSDPAGRMGAPPWKVAIMDPHSLYDRTAESALKLGGGEARPGAPFVGLVQTGETAWIWDQSPRRTVLDVGLVVPALTSEGWWNATIVVLADGTSRGYARYCPWGDLHAEGGAEILMMRGTARRREEGWLLDLTVEIPPRAKVRAPGQPAAHGVQPLVGGSTRMTSGEPGSTSPVGEPGAP